MSLVDISRVYLKNIPDNSRANELVLWCVRLIVFQIPGFMVIWFSLAVNCLLKSLIFVMRSRLSSAL